MLQQVLLNSSGSASIETCSLHLRPPQTSTMSRQITTHLQRHLTQPRRQFFHALYGRGRGAQLFSNAATETHTPTADKSVRLSERCVARLHELARKRSGVVLRVSVDGGGCSGFQYQFELQDPNKGAKADDVRISKDGATVIIDSLSLEYINGSTVDYTQEMISSSFQIVDNPNSESSCGCGVSFSPKM